MSRFGTILDAVETITRAAQTDLRAGSEGFERTVRAGGDLAKDELPHVFLHDPALVRTQLLHQQSETLLSFQLDFWAFEETQEQMLTRLEAVQDAIRADRSLGGLVTRAEITTLQVPDYFTIGTPHRTGLLLVECEVTDL